MPLSVHEPLHWQELCVITILDYVVDLSTFKQGRYMPGNHLRIYPPEHLLEDRPDYLLILAGDHLYRMDLCDLVDAHIERLQNEIETATARLIAGAKPGVSPSG